MAKEEDLPLTWTQRIRDLETAQDFEDAQEELEDRSRKYGKSATGLFLMRLGLQKLEEMEELDSEIEEAVPE